MIYQIRVDEGKGQKHPKSPSNFNQTTMEEVDDEIMFQR